MRNTATVLLLIVLFIFGCASEKKRWENAKLKSTKIAYEDYLKKYPKGLYSDSAQVLLEKLVFKQAQQVDSVKAYEDFIKTYPRSAYADSAQILLEKLYYGQAQKINTKSAYAGFIKKFPESPFAKTAAAKIRIIELIKTCPFELVPGESISLTRGGTLTITFTEGKIKSLESEDWLIQGLGGRLLDVDQSGSFSTGGFTLHWTDQPFQVSYNGKTLASFKNTEEYTNMQKE